MSDAKAACSSREEVEAVVLHLRRKPQAGDRIEGTGGARKVRFPGRGKGKSGGYRVISYFSGDDVPVFLLNVFAKGEKVNLSKAERNALKKMLRSTFRFPPSHLPFLHRIHRQTETLSERFSSEIELLTHCSHIDIVGNMCDKSLVYFTARISLGSAGALQDSFTGGPQESINFPRIRAFSSCRTSQQQGMSG